MQFKTNINSFHYTTRRFNLRMLNGMCNFDKLFYTGISTKCNYVVYQLSSISFNLKYKTIEYIEMRSCTKPYFDNKMKINFSIAAICYWPYYIDYYVKSNFDDTTVIQILDLLL